jgi:hypothetical protein
MNNMLIPRHILSHIYNISYAQNTKIMLGISNKKNIYAIMTLGVNISIHQI